MTGETNSFKLDSKTLNERLDVDFALRAARLGVWELDPVTGLINWDARCRALFGLADDTPLAYDQATNHIHPDDVVRVDEAIKWAINPRSGGTYDITYRTIGADDGLLRWVRFMGQGYFTDTGEVIRFAGVAQDVTDDIRTQQIIATEERFRAIVEQTPAATMVLRGDNFTVEQVNGPMLALIGQRDEIIGKLLLALMPELENEFAWQQVKKVYHEGTSFDGTEVPVIHSRAGVTSEHYYDIAYRPLKEGDQTTGMIQVVTDVTEQVVTRKKLEQSEQYFRHLTDTVPAILWITEPDGNCSYLNRQWYDLTGQTREEAEGFGWLDATHPDDKLEAGKIFVEANEKQVPFDLQYRLRLKGGHYRWVIDRGNPNFSTDGAYKGMIGTVVDIHDQKMAEEEADRFRYMAENASDPFILMRHDGTFAYLNKPALDRWGYTADEARFIRVPDVDPIYNEVVFAAAFARAQTEKIPPFETLHRKKDGTTYPVEVSMGGLMLGKEPHLFAVARNITERKEAERALQKSETLFRHVTSSSPTGLWLADKAGGLTYLNRTLVDWTGLPYETLLGAGWVSAIVEEDRQRSIDAFLTAVATRTHYDVQFQLNKADGSVIWCRAAGDPYYHDDGHYAGYAGYCMDINELVVRREALQQSEAKLRSVIANAPAAIGLFVGQDLIIEMPNQAFIDTIGKGPDIVGKPLREVMPELEGQPFLQILDEVYTTGRMFQSLSSQVNIVRHGVMTDDFYNITYSPLFDAEGNVYAILDIAIVVTSEVVAKRKIAASEARFRSIVEQAPMAIGVLKGREMIIEIGNDRLFEVWGKNKSVTGMRLIDALPELKGQVFIGLMEVVYDTGEPFFGNGVLAMLERGGVLEERYFDFAYTPLRDESGTVSGVMVMATEVTSQVLARQKVEEAEANLRGAIALADLGTWELDVATGTVTYSDRVKSWFGFSGDPVPLSTAYKPIHEKDRSRVEAAIAAALQPGTTGTYDEEYTLLEQHTGYERIVHAQGKTFFDTQGRPIKITGTAQDVTEQRETQLALEQLVQARTEELAATNEELTATNEELTESNQLLFRSNENLQQFAYIASHDLQEPLRKIQSFGDLLKKQYAPALGDGIGHLDRMQAAASRMSLLIKDLLAFSRISTQQDASGTVSLNQVINTVLADLDLTVQETGAGVVVSPLPMVQGDPSQLGQLFQNLLSNALKFRRWDEAGVPVTPQIRVNARLVALGDLPPAVRPTRGAAAYHHIDVSDNGIGFEEKYVDRIFQVFQRLHGRSEFAGTGIGLAICAKVAANHGGAITAHSEPGRGSTFSVYLPC